MNKITISIIYFLLLIISCNNKTQNNNVENNSIIEQEKNTNINEPNKKMYVNASSGLRVRINPSTEDEMIGLLDNYTEVNILMEENNFVEINNVVGKWVYINTPIEGWIFNGFLSEEIQIDPNVIVGLWQILNYRTDYGNYFYFGMDNAFRYGLTETSMVFEGRWSLVKNVITITNLKYIGYSDEKEDEMAPFIILLNIIDNNNIELTDSNWLGYNILRRRDNIYF